MSNDCCDEDQKAPPCDDEKGKDEAPGLTWDDDLEPPCQIIAVEVAKAITETSTGIAAATVAIHSDAPDARKAREEVEKKYAAEYDAGGALQKKKTLVLELLERAAAELLTNAPGMPSLQKWADTHLSADGKLSGLFNEVKGLRSRVNRTMPSLGPREQALADAAANTAQWKAAFAAWSSPAQAIDAKLGQITTELADIKLQPASKVNQEIYRLFFELTPRLLSVLNKQPRVLDKAIEILSGKLTEYPDKHKLLNPDYGHEDGSVYLIAPECLAKKREDVLKAWDAAAKAEAEALASYRLRKDDYQTLKARLDALAQSEDQRAREILA